VTQVDALLTFTFIRTLETDHLGQRCSTPRHNQSQADSDRRRVLSERAAVFALSKDLAGLFTCTLTPGLNLSAAKGWTRRVNPIPCGITVHITTCSVVGTSKPAGTLRSGPPDPLSRNWWAGWEGGTPRVPSSIAVVVLWSRKCYDERQGGGMMPPSRLVWENQWRAREPAGAGKQKHFANITDQAA
jgi:hypothetical protein